MTDDVVTRIAIQEEARRSQERENNSLWDAMRENTKATNALATTLTNFQLAWEYKRGQERIMSLMIGGVGGLFPTIATAIFNALAHH